MKLLIIGGTRFTGRYLTEAALARGHEVTLFNRGRAGLELFPQAEQVIGDRAESLEALEGRHFDAVIDMCGFVPGAVRKSAELFRDVEVYTFLSSISVYADLSQKEIEENAALKTITEEQMAGLEGNGPFYELYGELKAACEQTVEEVLPGRALIIRPGLIVGPHDYSDRFTYWPERIARGGDVLAPGRPERQIQVIDARDLAEWTLRMTEEKRAGVYNAVGPDAPLTMQAFLEAGKAALGSDANFVWADDSWLLEQEVGQWMEMPLWLAEEDVHVGMMQTNINKAVAAGLTFRPIGETIRDTLAWDRTRPAEQERLAGMKPAREAELLALLNGQKQA